MSFQHTSAVGVEQVGRGTMPFPFVDGEALLHYHPDSLLPAFREVSLSARPELFVKKLKMTSVVFDFSAMSKDVREKELKRQNLLDLVDYIQSGKNVVHEGNLHHVFSFLERNIFRTLPPSASLEPGMDGEEIDASPEPSWSHLHLVYEFFLRFIVSSDTDPKVSRKYLDNAFIVRLLELFDTEDLRERDFLKTILHRVYGKFMTHRPFIRRAINNIFFRFIYETERHNGIAELLEILGSIINGFALPLKEEHKVFLTKALLPLHKPKNIASYHQQLSYCVSQFVEKDPALAPVVLKGLFRFWPVQSTQKELLFLHELEEVLDITQSKEFEEICSELFSRLSRCLQSHHFQVSERALFYWNNEYFINLVNKNRRIIFPIICPAIEQGACKHWNEAVHNLCCNVRDICKQMDAELYFQVEENARIEADLLKVAKESRQATWVKLQIASRESM